MWTAEMVMLQSNYVIFFIGFVNKIPITITEIKWTLLVKGLAQLQISLRASTVFKLDVLFVRR